MGEQPPALHGLEWGKPAAVRARRSWSTASSSRLSSSSSCSAAGMVRSHVHHGCTCSTRRGWEQDPPQHHPAAPMWLEGRGQAAGRPPQPCRSVISKDKAGRARQRSSLTKLTSSHPSPRGQGSHPELRCRVRALLPWPSCSQAAFGPHSPPRLPAVLGRSQQCWHVESWRWDLAAGFADEGRAASPKNGSFARFGVG